jgi:hypothetical protein
LNIEYSLEPCFDSSSLALLIFCILNTVWSSCFGYSSPLSPVPRLFYWKKPLIGFGPDLLRNKKGKQDLSSSVCGGKTMDSVFPHLTLTAGFYNFSI